MTWFKDFGFEYNPFSIKPLYEFELFFDDKSVVEDVIDVINSGKNIVLKGPLGSGKTSILKKIINNFGGQRKLFYYNAFSASNPLNFDVVLKRAGGFFSRVLGLKSKNVILFIDEAHHLSEDNLAELKSYLDKHFKSVILASSDKDYAVPEELKDDFDFVVNVGKFSENDVLNIVKDRLGEDYSDILIDKEVKDVFKNSTTPREFILKCDDACKHKFSS